MIIPQKTQIQRIFKFSDSFTNDDKIVIHCFAGVSRSTAISIAILCYHGVNPEDAINQIKEVRDCLWPNDLIIKYADEILEKNGSLISAVSDFKKNNLEDVFLALMQENQENKEVL